MPNKNIDFPKVVNKINYKTLDELVRMAFDEDFGGRGDITSDTLFTGSENPVAARIIAKEEGVICGSEIVRYVYSHVDNSVMVRIMVKDGSPVKPGDVVAEINGKPQCVTKGERIALNFLGMLSGIASKVNRLARLIKNTKTRLLDTRKTLPGMRELEKYAVYTGGGFNHRVGLYDMILIKDNHIAAGGGIARCVELARESHPSVVIEIETSSIGQVREALSTTADILMLDNMDNGAVREAVGIINGAKLVEVSGNVDENRLVELAAIGVDFVSMGSLTHTIRPLDLSLQIG